MLESMLTTLAAWGPIIAAVLAAVYRMVVRPALGQWLANHNRDAFYAAVKFGLRVASQLGLSADELFQVATTQACWYIEQFSGINLDEDKIANAIRAEFYKLWQEEQKLAGILGTPPELTPTPPAPAPSPLQPPFQIMMGKKA